VATFHQLLEVDTTLVRLSAHIEYSTMPSFEDYILDSPAMEAPPGEISNLTNPPNQNTKGFAGAGAALGTATLFTALKIWSRLAKKRRLEVEDCMYIGNCSGTSS
jgi:hypothetical protein